MLFYESSSRAPVLCVMDVPCVRGTYFRDRHCFTQKITHHLVLSNGKMRPWDNSLFYSVRCVIVKPVTTLRSGPLHSFSYTYSPTCSPRLCWGKRKFTFCTEWLRIVPASFTFMKMESHVKVLVVGIVRWCKMYSNISVGLYFYIYYISNEV